MTLIHMECIEPFVFSTWFIDSHTLTPSSALANRANGPGRTPNNLQCIRLSNAIILCRINMHISPRYFVCVCVCGWAPCAHHHHRVDLYLFIWSTMSWCVSMDSWLLLKHHPSTNYISTTHFFPHNVGCELKIHKACWPPRWIGPLHFCKMVQLI